MCAGVAYNTRVAYTVKVVRICAYYYHRRNDHRLVVSSDDCDCDDDVDTSNMMDWGIRRKEKKIKPTLLYCIASTITGASVFFIFLFFHVFHYLFSIFSPPCTLTSCFFDFCVCVCVCVRPFYIFWIIIIFLRPFLHYIFCRTRSHESIFYLPRYANRFVDAWKNHISTRDVDKVVCMFYVCFSSLHLSSDFILFCSSYCVYDLIFIFFIDTIIPTIYSLLTADIRLYTCVATYLCAAVEKNLC